MIAIELTCKVRNGDQNELTLSLRENAEAMLAAFRFGRMIGEAARLAAGDEIGHVLRGFSTRLDGPEAQVLHELAVYLTEASLNQQDPRDHIAIDWVDDTGGDGAESIEEGS